MVLEFITAGLGLFGAANEASAARQNARAQREAAQLAYDAAIAANDTNAAIAAQNLAQEWAMFETQLEYAIEQRDAERLGGSDAAGNRMYWDPEEGWRILLEPTSQSLLDSSQRQQMLNQTVVDGQERERITRANELQRGDAQQASSELDMFRNVEKRDANALADMFFQVGEQARGDARDGMLDQLLMTQSRQGNTSNIPDILSAFAGQAGQDASTARIQADIQGLYESANLYNTERGIHGDAYTLFRDRAVQPFGATVQPSGQVTNLSAPATAGNSSGISAAFSRGAPQQDYIQPNFAAANLAMANGAANATRANGTSNLINNIGAFLNTDAISGLFSDTNRTPTTNTNDRSSGGFFTW